METARRASIADEEAYQLKSIELAARASSSIIVAADKSTTDDVVIFNGGTT